MDHDARERQRTRTRATKPQRANVMRTDVGSDVTIDDIATSKFASSPDESGEVDEDATSNASKLAYAAHDDEDDYDDYYVEEEVDADDSMDDVEEDDRTRSQRGRSSARSTSGHRSDKSHKERHGKSRKERHGKSRKKRHGKSHKGRPGNRSMRSVDEEHVDAEVVNVSEEATLSKAVCVWRERDRALSAPFLRASSESASSARADRLSKTEVRAFQHWMDQRVVEKANAREGNAYSASRGVDENRGQHGRSPLVPPSARVHSAQHKPRRGDRYDFDQEPDRKRIKVGQASPASSSGRAAVPATYVVMAVEPRTFYTSQRADWSHNVPRGTAGEVALAMAAWAVVEEQVPVGKSRSTVTVESLSVSISRNDSNKRTFRRVKFSGYKTVNLDMSAHFK